MYYTYLWLREDGTPYYIGKGSGGRAYTSWAHGVHRPADKTRILVQEHPCEADAFAVEKFLIAYYGRLDVGTGCLRNLTDGGEGPSGSISKKKGTKLPEAIKGRISLTLKAKGIVPPNQKGFHHSQETKKRISRTSLGVPKTKEHVQRVTEALRALPKKPRTIPKCHPERKHEAKGLCAACYVRLRRQQ
jgi:hypothetical protein